MELGPRNPRHLLQLGECELHPEQSTLPVQQVTLQARRTLIVRDLAAVRGEEMSGLGSLGRMMVPMGEEIRKRRLNRMVSAAIHEDRADVANGALAERTNHLVKSTSYILKKYKKAAPSVVLHLHPTHFRFDQQDGSFSYNSSMRFLLEHLKAETVPHDMIDELLLSGVKFYEGTWYGTDNKACTLTDVTRLSDRPGP